MDFECFHLRCPCSPPQSRLGKPFAVPPSGTRQHSRTLLIHITENLTLKRP